MRRYETIIIVDTELTEEDRSSLFERVQDIISRHDGFLILFDEWGAKKLAYEIKKKSRGYYTRIDYCGSGILVNEMERFFKITDSFLKYMTILLDKNADLESIKEAIAAEEKEKELAAEAAQTPPAEPEIEDKQADVSDPENPKSETIQTESKDEE
jgi:small subunit ribosomal protein S6